MQSEDGKLNRIVGMIFSKDRAMQLDATLKSLDLNCKDRSDMDVKVLYTVSNPIHENQYDRLTEEYTSVEFIKERDFTRQLLSSMESYPFILFLVDDNIMVRHFSIKDITEALSKHDDALGFSLRLGRNTQYCYSLNAFQKLPDFTFIEKGFIKFDWTAAEYDFGYPLEVSSSVYRTKDLFSLLTGTEFSNPNTLEFQLASHTYQYAGIKNCIISNETSITFCNPVNKVQHVYNNRVGTKAGYTSHELSQMFEQGYRIDVEKYSGFLPNACHQEVELVFIPE